MEQRPEHRYGDGHYLVRTFGGAVYEELNVVDCTTANNHPDGASRTGHLLKSLLSIAVTVVILSKDATPAL